MQQYFSNKKIDNVLYFEESDIHHIKNVMRMKSGCKVIVNYEGVSYNAILNSGYKSATIESIYKEKDNSVYVKAYIPVLNEEKMSFIIEKGTEMGVSEFSPINFKHSKFILSKDKEEKKLERWRKIAKEASEQSRRINIPKVNEIININDIKCVKGVNILCSLDSENVKKINKVLKQPFIYDTINIVFGPEGGISKDEEEILESIGFIKTSLGNNVLRTETVIIVVMSIINYLNG